MFRSEFGNQRQLAIRMLSGILLRREWVVSLEAYSSELGQYTRFGQNICNEIGQRSNVFYMLCECFENILMTLIQKFQFSVEDEILYISHNVEISTGSNTNATDRSYLYSIYMNQDIINRLRKVIVSLLIHLLCTSDLPVELPTLLLWAVTSSNTSGISSMGINSKLALLRCIRFYLFSPIEELCSSIIRDSSILWSSYYIPGLSTPHNRRVDVKYELFLLECSEKVKNIYGSSEETDPSNKNANINELFALKCRWGRVDIFAKNEYMDSNLIAQISLYITNAISYIINNNIEHSSCQSSSMEMNYFLGVQALEVLTSFLRQGRTCTVSLIRDAILDVFITQFILLIDFTNSELSNMKFQLFRLAGWKFLIELGIRDRNSSEYLFGRPHATTYCLHSLMVRRFTTVWGYDNESVTSFHIEESKLIFRLLKVSLVYGTGLQCCSEMLLAIMIKSASTNSLAVNELIQDNFIYAEIFNLLEQAVVTTSSILAHHTSSSRETFIQVKGDEKFLTDAVEFSRSVLAFTKQYWLTIETYISRQNIIVAQHNDAAPLSAIQISMISSVISFICSLFICRCPLNKQSFSESESYSSDRSYCNAVLAQRINNNICLRGLGLIDSIHLFVQSQVSVVNHHSHTIVASIVHLDGQCMELLDLCCEQQFLEIRFVLNFSDLLLSKISHHLKKVDWKTAEFILSLQRYISVSYLTYLYNISFNLKFSTILLKTHTYEQFDCTVKLMQLCSDLMVVEDKIVLKLGSVSSGLFQWHLQRLYHASVLLNILFRSSIVLISKGTGMSYSNNVIHNAQSVSYHSVLEQNNLNDFNVLVSKCLHTFNSYIFSGVHKFIFFSYLKCLVCTSVRKELHKQIINNSSSTTDVVVVLNENNYSGMEEKYSNIYMDIYNSLFNKKSLVQDLNILSIDNILNNYNVISGMKYCASINSSDEWLMVSKSEEESENVLLYLSCTHPYMQSWPYKTLMRLSGGGDTLDIWLQVLNIDFVNLIGSNNSSSMRESSILYDMAFAIHSLIQLANSDHMNNWLLNDIDSDESKSIELNINISAVESYSALLQKLSFYVLYLENKLRIENYSFASEFTLVAQNEFSSSNLVAKVIGEMKPHSTNNMRNKTQGILDICDKSIEAVINQVITYEVHAATIITLIAPNMPWMIRLRVWKQVGELKLLHLMNNEEYLVSVLPLHILRPKYISNSNNSINNKNQFVSQQSVCESFSLYVTMIEALSKLRVESDRSMGIVAIALFQISHFIFRNVRYVNSITVSESGQEGFILIEAFSKQLLNDLISKVFKDKNLLWILHSIITIGTNFDELNLQCLFDFYNNLESFDYPRDNDRNFNTLHKLKSSYATLDNSIDTTIKFNITFNQDDGTPISIHLNKIFIDFNEQNSYNLFDLLNSKDFSKFNDL